MVYKTITLPTELLWHTIRKCGAHLVTPHLPLVLNFHVGLAYVPYYSCPTRIAAVYHSVNSITGYILVGQRPPCCYVTTRIIPGAL